MPSHPRPARGRSFRLVRSLVPVPCPHPDPSARPGLLSRAEALHVATRFVLESGQAPPVVPASGRPFVLDPFTREWHVVFEEEADAYLALVTGHAQPGYRRVAVHAETGAARWVED